MDAAAEALGISEAKLFRKLRSGRTLEQIAKAEGKDYADVKAAIRSAVKTELDAAVKDGRLTQQQADDMLEHLTEHLDEGRSSAARPGRPGRGGFGPPGDRDGAPRRPLGLSARAIGLGRHVPAAGRRVARVEPVQPRGAPLLRRAVVVGARDVEVADRERGADGLLDVLLGEAPAAKAEDAQTPAMQSAWSSNGLELLPRPSVKMPSSSWRLCAYSCAST